jgi:YD repeat-containing protein
MKFSINHILLTILVCLQIGCDKDDSSSPNVPINDQCVIKTEATSLVGNEASWNYEFDADGRPATITKFNRYGQVESTLKVSKDRVIVTRGTNIIETVYDTDIFKDLPSQSQVSITLDGVTHPDYWTYFFSYDDKKRLIKVNEHTEDLTNDWEWELEITYNDRNNVTQLSYQWTSGSADINPPTTISSYDDKPTPYASMGPQWKFLLSSFAWDNYDPEPVITALSANNPLDYTLGTGGNTFKRTMTYTYNEQGFPVERRNTNKNTNGEYTFIQTFSYDCK